MWLVAFRKRLTEATLRGGAYETLLAALLAALTVFTSQAAKIENPAEPGDAGTGRGTRHAHGTGADAGGNRGTGTSGGGKGP